MSISGILDGMRDIFKSSEKIQDFSYQFGLFDNLLPKTEFEEIADEKLLLGSLEDFLRYVKKPPRIDLENLELYEIESIRDTADIQYENKLKNAVKLRVMDKKGKVYCLSRGYCTTPHGKEYEKKVAENLKDININWHELRSPISIFNEEMKKETLLNEYLNILKEDGPVTAVEMYVVPSTHEKIDAPQDVQDMLLGKEHIPTYIASFRFRSVKKIRETDAPEIKILVANVHKGKEVTVDIDLVDERVIGIRYFPGVHQYGGLIGNCLNIPITEIKRGFPQVWLRPKGEEDFQEYTVGVHNIDPKKMEELKQLPPDEPTIEDVKKGLSYKFSP